MTIPNLITIARLIAVPMLIYLLLDSAWQSAALLFLAAGISDGVDGFIARQFNQRSTLGAYLDPMADKLLLVSVFVVLALMGHLPTWLVVLVVSRDVLIVVAVMLSSVLDHPIEVRPIFVSKANTACQIALAVIVLGQLAFGIGADLPRNALVLAVATLTVVSAAAYLVTWLRHMAGYTEQ